MKDAPEWAARHGAGGCPSDFESSCRCWKRSAHARHEDRDATAHHELRARGLEALRGVPPRAPEIVCGRRPAACAVWGWPPRRQALGRGVADDRHHLDPAAFGEPANCRWARRRRSVGCALPEFQLRSNKAELRDRGSRAGRIQAPRPEPCRRDRRAQVIERAPDEPCGRRVASRPGLVRVHGRQRRGHRHVPAGALRRRVRACRQHHRVGEEAAPRRHPSLSRLKVLPPAPAPGLPIVANPVPPPPAGSCRAAATTAPGAPSALSRAERHARGSAPPVAGGLAVNSAQPTTGATASRLRSQTPLTNARIALQCSGSTRRLGSHAAAEA